jgi:5'-nucleotidase
LLNESDAVNAEAERLVKEEGVFTNIVLSHCGYDVEKEIAKRATSRISLVVGGHSHSFLYTGGAFRKLKISE